jgi:hypothetical protein
MVTPVVVTLVVVTLVVVTLVGVTLVVMPVTTITMMMMMEIANHPICIVLKQPRL